MSANYDNWERLVSAVLKKQQLWELFHEHSRSPSLLSEASGLSSSFSSRPPLDDLAVDLASLGSSSTYRRTPKLILISDFSPVIDVEDVHVAYTELLGRGTFGISYAAQMQNGAKIVVKRLNYMRITETEFNHQMAIVGNVMHDNVVSLRAYYSSEDERVMLYDHDSKGSVCAMLHGRNGEPRPPTVDWQTRLRIAIGVARGISEIHKHNGGKLVHGNIKTSNIFCKADEFGCVSDLGPANFMETTFVHPKYYHAPEVKKTRDLSQASDVYSFGVLILELLTRKPSAYVPGGPQAVDLVKLVTSVKNRIRAAHVFDVDLLKNPMIKEKMVKMLEIGIKCVEKSVKKRPKMFEVMKLLVEITVLDPVNSPIAHGSNKLVFIEDSYAKFDLEVMLRASAEVLGKGTFGTCYKAKLEEGNTIVVKRLREVIVPFEDFQQHMGIIGGMKHKNVDTPRAFYYSKDEKILVYDYYDQGSVYALLHGNRGSGKTPFDWETRVRIAVGAARGIAHIHLQHGQKFVHGNVKSSNIFVNRQNDGIVSEAGLGKFMSTVRQAPGYFAPEDTDSRRVSQASDVYGFGVVLLEIISGKPSQFTTYDGKVILLIDWIQSVLRDEWSDGVFDFELLGHKDFELFEEAMVLSLQLGVECVSAVPEHRPRMSEVVRVLEDISGIEPLTESGSEDRWEQPLSIEARLEDLLENMLPKLVTINYYP